MNVTLHLIDLSALSPLLILFIGALLMLLFESFASEKVKSFLGAFTAIIIITAMVSAYFSPTSNNELLTPWMKFDPLARFFTLFFLSIGLCTTLLSDAFFKKFSPSKGEFYFLSLSALFGLILIGSAADFLTLFIGLETLSIPLYVLCGYMKKWELSQEASVKYFLIGAVAAGFLLYGIALVYGAVGTTQLDALLPAFRSLDAVQDKLLFLSGTALITLGLAFKAAVVPFHLWAPDVYDGAPTPVTAFMSVGTKVGAFAAFVRIFLVALPNFDPIWNQGIALLAYPTLIYANIVAMRQIQLRRFFAYSGIAHSGFLLIPLAVGTPEALTALTFYLVVYALATLGSFAVLATLDKTKEGVMMQDLQGLFKQSPYLAALFALCLLTLAGIPPTAGFFAKFYIFKLAFQSGYYGLVFVGLLMTIVSAYYYMRIVSVMFTDATGEPSLAYPSRAVATVGLVSFAGIALLSLYPAPLLALINFFN